MGTYVNIGNAGFVSARNGEYVYMSGLIAVTKNILNSPRRFSCVTRSHTCTQLLAMMAFTISPVQNRDYAKKISENTMISYSLVSTTTRRPRCMSA